MSNDDLNVSTNQPTSAEEDAYYNSIAASTVQGTKADDYVSIITSYNNGEPDDVDTLTPDEYEQFKKEHARLNLPALADGPGNPSTKEGPVTTGTGNTIGKITWQPRASNAQTNEANPKVEPETPEEKSLWSELTDWFGEGVDGIPDAIDHPEMAALGAGKSLMNSGLDVLSLLAQGATYQASGEMMQTATIMSATGNSAQGDDMMRSAQDVYGNAHNVNFDAAKATLNTPAEHAGDVAIQVGMTIADGAGLVKGLAAVLSKLAAKKAAVLAAKSAVEGAEKEVAHIAENGAAVPPRKIEGEGKTAADKDASPSKSDSKEGGDVDTGTCASDPVDVATGELLQILPVINLPGTLPLTLTRQYRSRSTQSGLFGEKWSDNWSQSLLLNEDEIHFTNHEGTSLSYYASGQDVDALNLHQPYCRLYGTRSGSLFVYNRNTQLTLCFDPQPQARRLLSAARDNAGNTVRFLYKENRLIRLVHSDGWHIELDYQQQQLAHITRVEGAERQWLASCVYDHTGRLAECKTFQFTHLWHEYDAPGHMTRWHDSDKTDVHYRYDAKGRVTDIHGTGGYFCDRFIYDELNRRTTYIDGEDGRTYYEYNSAGRVTRATDPLGRVTQTLWDHGNKVRETDPLGRETDYLYNDFGQVVRVTDATGDVVRYEYNDAGQVTALTQPDGKIWRFEWSEQGRLLSRTEPQGRVYLYEYDAHGQCISEHHPDGATWRYAYNAQYQLAAVIAPDDATTRFEQDAFGRVTSVTDPLGYLTRYSHSLTHAGPEGSVTRVHLPDGVTQRVRYDGEKRRASVTDGEGKTTRYVYGECDLLLAVIRPDGQTLRFDYDSLTRLKQVTRPQGETYHFVRDAAGQVISETDFTGRRVTYGYDAAGRRTEARHPDGRIIRWHYSLRDELVRQDIWQSTETPPTLLATTHYAWDMQGRMVQAQNEDARVEFEFDEEGHLVCERLNGQAVMHQWDEQSHRVLSRESGGVALSYEYDIAGRIAKMQADDFSPLQREYDARGQERRRYSAAGFSLTQDYSPTGMLLAQTAGADTVNRRWQYDGAYNVRSIEDTRWGTSQYRYNQNDQIIHAEQRGIQPLLELFSYDDNLNLSEQSFREGELDREAERITQEQSAGRVVRRGGSVYRYDSAGRLVEKCTERAGYRPQVWQYRWNAHSQLSGLITPDNARWHYAYDPFGRRISKRCEGQSGGYIYLWSADQMIAEMPVYADGTPAYEERVQWLYEPEALTPVARYAKGKLHYVVSDHMGTPRELLTENGSLARANRLSTWGCGRAWRRRVANDDEVDCNLRFAGQYADEESGLHYNRHRYYDSETGQYLSPDPIGLEGGLNLYSYVPNPLKYVDPLGLCKKSVDTPYGSANQSNSPEALAARAKVENGATLYRMGTTQRSETTGAQFWALEHPSTPGYAGRYGIPQENIDRSNFIMTAKLKPGAEHVTRPAPGIGGNAGGGIEVVVPPDAVDIITFSKY